ncbi:4-galactosyl-N-acetylglucosaminide 3-alpha-L-fucosyltransferase FUT6-like [Penaeus chinensis]|uniref:4-galactosyl-N-acetylglucosaminide 3-alpha-L-fucosyltransferase FUT6-like n=1 Tax=Penaeus chinensis TaxID=139456 RepID=UPI001FB71F1C|nr:4-galactosyl-N-acetylglucosaminide 3-alpha-L-fucosyltransferase FUT6-like [Penaeus chinensis]
MRIWRLSKYVKPVVVIVFCALSLLVSKTSEEMYEMVYKQVSSLSVKELEEEQAISEDVPLDFKDPLFAPILDTFKEAASKTYQDVPKNRFRNGPVPHVFVYSSTRMASTWLRAHMEDIENRMCPHTCTFTRNPKMIQSSDAVLIHLWNVKSRRSLLHFLGPRDPSQPWIMLENETHLRANIKTGLAYSTLNGIFNRTFYFRSDADIRMIHGFIVRRGKEASLLPPHWVRQPEMRRENATRQMAVAFISDCIDHSGRLKYIDELKKHIHVDVYGKCGSMQCGASRTAAARVHVDMDTCLSDAARNYHFYLAFENAICKDYVTEKLYNVLYYPLVPVVLGGANYSSLLPPNSYIDANQHTPEALAKILVRLAGDPEEYESYLKWKKYYQPSTVGSSKVFCDLCAKLHDEKLYEENTISDFYGWFVTKDYCRNV